jgi:DNA-binding response OmpR family regulator
MYTGRRILVVEDEPLIATLIADWLLELDYEVAGTVNAALLDVTLGADNSFSLADALLAKGVPVAFITGQDSHSMPERFRQAPVLGKPFDFEAMQALLSTLVKVRGQPSI